MTPMIDIVFLLIIFFMTVSQISRSIDQPLQLPDVGAGGQPPETVDITINLDAGGQLMVVGQVRSLEQLVQALTRELRQVDNQPGRLRILVRCDRDCPGRHVNELLGRLEMLGIRQVRVSVQAQRE